MPHNQLDKTNFQDTGNEHRWPPLWELIKWNNLVPIAVYYLFFRVLAIAVNRFTWKSATGFKGYRLHNVTVCLIHSFISGGFVLGFAMINPFAMFVEPMQWYQDWSRHILLFSISYFIHDALDMLKYEVSRFTIELIFHHFCSAAAFVAVVTARKFIPFAYLALLMEVNSVFLHVRTLMQLSGQATELPFLYRIVQILNIITFVIVRFGVQGWQAIWIINRANTMHMFWFILGFGGCVVFAFINGFLFIRILASDGYFGGFSRKLAAINRDDDVEKKEPQKAH